MARSFFPHKQRVDLLITTHVLLRSIRQSATTEVIEPTRPSPIRTGKVFNFIREQRFRLTRERLCTQTHASPTHVVGDDEDCSAFIRRRSSVRAGAPIASFRTRGALGADRGDKEAGEYHPLPRMAGESRPAFPQLRRAAEMVCRRPREVLGDHLGIFRRNGVQAILKGTVPKEDAGCKVVRGCGVELRRECSSREGPARPRYHLRERGHQSPPSAPAGNLRGARFVAPPPPAQS